MSWMLLPVYHEIVENADFGAVTAFDIIRRRAKKQLKRHKVHAPFAVKFDLQQRRIVLEPRGEELAKRALLDGKFVLQTTEVKWFSKKTLTTYRKHDEAEKVFQRWLFGISQGQGVGLPNLLGARRKEPEQVRDSDTSPLQTPRDPQRLKQIVPVRPIRHWNDRWSGELARDAAAGKARRPSSHHFHRRDNRSSISMYQT